MKRITLMLAALLVVAIGCTNILGEYSVRHNDADSGNEEADSSTDSPTD